MARNREYHVSLTKRERSKIRRLQKKTDSPNRRTRYAIILEADENRHGRIRPYSEIAGAAGACVCTVISTPRAFCEDGLSAAVTPKRSPRSDTSRLKATGDAEAKIVAKACTPPPEGYARWTLRLLSEESAVILEERLSRSTIGRLLNRNELHPHLSEYWCIPPNEDADFVACMEDILDLYQRPHNPRFPLWCMDEKPYQILGEAREPLPMRPGDTAKFDSDYIRNGTVSVFCFIQPNTGRIVHSVEPTRTAVDWAEKVKYLVDVVEPDAERIILVMDNLNTHSISSLYKAFPPEEARRIAKKLEVYYTPKHRSWLDIAEIAINIITMECLDRRIPSIDELKKELKVWNDFYDKNPTPINWQFKTQDARIKLKRLYPDINKFREDRDKRRRLKLDNTESEQPDNN